MEIFQDAKGQLTPQSIIGSGRISNSFEPLWLSSLSARMKMIILKMKVLEWPQFSPFIILSELVPVYSTSLD